LFLLKIAVVISGRETEAESISDITKVNGVTGT
jgi:hypothetical protein